MKEIRNDLDFTALLAAWHDNVELTLERREELLVRLAEDPQLRQELAREIQMAGLTKTVQGPEPQWLRLEEVLQSTGTPRSKEETTEEAVMGAIARRTDRSDTSTRQGVSRTAQQANTGPRDITIKRSRTIAGWVALSVLAAALLIGAFVQFRDNESSGNGERQEKRLGIARVLRIESQGTGGDGRQILDGSELFAGEELTMTQGLIELAFRETGVHVIATAPLRMKLHSDQRVSLHEGQVKLVVPPQGVGFVVDTAQRKFVDLGTSFVVTASSNGSDVLVLDGLISVDDHNGTSGDLMREGEFARFDRDGKIKKRSPSRLSLALPELSLPVTNPGDGSLHGVVLGYGGSIAKDRLAEDVIGRELLPLIQSGFRDHASLEAFKQSEPLSFRGIAGAFHEFPDRTGLAPYSREGGWMAWYHGQVIPPRAGRYRFWGYADNHLLVAINGKPVFEGSRRESSFKTLGILRTDNPALPCLIAPAGFACSDWIEVSGDPVRLDILFGEVGGNITSGLLLVEREGESYEETFWGQPKWPLFLTEVPGDDETAEFGRLVDHLEHKTMGSFSIAADAVWKVH